MKYFFCQRPTYIILMIDGHGEVPSIPPLIFHSLPSVLDPLGPSPAPEMETKLPRTSVRATLMLYCSSPSSSLSPLKTSYFIIREQKTQKPWLDPARSPQSVTQSGAYT